MNRSYDIRPVRGFEAYSQELTGDVKRRHELTCFFGGFLHSALGVSEPVRAHSQRLPGTGHLAAQLFEEHLSRMASHGHFGICEVDGVHALLREKACCP